MSYGNGDKLRITKRVDDGTVVWEGRVHDAGEDFFYVAGNCFSQKIDTPAWDRFTVEVLERAKVELVPGDVFVVQDGGRGWLRYYHGESRGVVDEYGVRMGHAASYGDDPTQVPIARFLVRNREVVS